ncbi:hypothetical protein IMZ48_26650 [Candidatus Bathyarchaeota archaeon]|nr:hypothetical protein [Candidatus Bathyarchaeota archaeon]
MNEHSLLPLAASGPVATNSRCSIIPVRSAKQESEPSGRPCANAASRPTRPAPATQATLQAILVCPNAAPERPPLPRPSIYASTDVSASGKP